MEHSTPPTSREQDEPVYVPHTPKKKSHTVTVLIAIAFLFFSFLAMKIGTNIGYANGVEDSQPTERELGFIKFGETKEQLAQAGRDWESAELQIEEANFSKSWIHGVAESKRAEINDMEIELGFLVDPQAEE